MNLFRLVALALLVWIAWFMWRNYRVKARQQQSRRGKGRVPAKVPGERIVKCLSCDLHLPEAQALREGDAWFCSKAHRRAWLEQH